MNIAAVLITTTLVVGCASSAPPKGYGTTPILDSRHRKEEIIAWGRTCTQGDAQVNITYQDTTGGAAVLFTTRGDKDLLREHVIAVAREHNSREPRVAQFDLYAIPHRAEAHYIAGGMKMTLVPGAWNDVDALRRNVQWDVLRLQQSGCTTKHELL